MSFYPMPRYLMRKHFLKKILEKLKCDDQNLFDFGYGAGDAFRMYHDMGFHISGYDFSEEAQTYCQNTNRDLPLELFTSIDQIPLNYYDFVIACEVLEHIEDAQAIVEQWRSYLKESGHLIISVPAHQSRWDANDVYSGHVKRYERNDLVELLVQCRFDGIQVFTYDFPSCLVLDKIRANRSALHIRTTNRGTNLEEDTKKSGIERDENKMLRFLAKEKFWVPIMRFQELFYKTDWGSAYIAVARKQ